VVAKRIGTAGEQHLQASFAHDQGHQNRRFARRSARKATPITGALGRRNGYITPVTPNRVGFEPSR
jgi:hypothetical protein